MDLRKDDIDLERAFPEEVEELDPAAYAKNIKKRKTKHLLIGILVFILIGCGLFAYFGCTIQTVTLKGTTLYSEEDFTKRLIAPKYTTHTLYAWFYYERLYDGEIPFIKSVDISIDGMHSVTATVTEKNVMGYFSYADAYLYFDDTGRIVESESYIVEGLPVIEGFDFRVAEKGEMLPIEDITQFQNLLSVTKLAKQNEIPLTNVTFLENGTMTILSNGIEVRLGLGTDLEQKMTLTATLLNQLSGKSGVLHMEDYDGTNGTRSFEEKIEAIE